jgi:tRNA pseudouridine38-40 synthase
MHRYQICIEYVGTNFIGWQIQKKGNSVQKFVQSVISKIIKEEVSLVGSGRTDAGVHAWGQSAHFECKKKIINSYKFIKSLNFFLNKKQISITALKKRNSNFNARYSAKERIYEYVIINRLAPPSIERNRAWHIRKKLDLEMIKKGAKKLSGTYDFSTFRASNCYSKSPIRTLKKIKVKRLNEKITIQFKSKSFLRNQVRSMVGCLKYLGEKKWSLKKFESVFKSKKRKLCAPPAPAHGLYLLKVNY